MMIRHELQKAVDNLESKLNINHDTNLTEMKTTKIQSYFDILQGIQLVKTYHNSFTSLNGRHESQYDTDALNEAYIKVNEKLVDENTEIKNIPAYFKMTYYNAIAMESRARKTKATLSMSTVTDIDGKATLDERLSKHYTDKQDISEYRELIRKVVKAIPQKRQRRLFVLYYVKGLTQKTIAEKTGKKQQSVSRSIKALNKCIANIPNMKQWRSLDTTPNKVADISLTAKGSIDKSFASTRYGEKSGKYPEPKTDYTLKGRENMKRLSIDDRDCPDHKFEPNIWVQPATFNLNRYSLAGFKKTINQDSWIDCTLYDSDSKSVGLDYIRKIQVYNLTACHSSGVQNKLDSWQWLSRLSIPTGEKQYNKLSINKPINRPIETRNREVEHYRQNQDKINTYAYNQNWILTDFVPIYSYTRPTINQYYITGSDSVFVPVSLPEIKGIAKQESMVTVPYQKIHMVYDKIVKDKIVNKPVYRPIKRLQSIAM